ncbi:diguanylate cyclase [Seleniivibrio woodruffii]|uniref:diguanylate cyclase n=1 Tax=Seleniivibrio woodruffii TaxID=1078050 RepID=UPI0026E923EB|nr:diguanylate cyclase [Seleniivibrio woodruffii]
MTNETEYNKTLILIVDDNQQNLKVLGNILRENTKYGLAFAMNGFEALDFISTTKPDMVLLDVMMPDMDGYEVCRQIKKDPKTANIPVIFITAKTEAEDAVLGFEAGGVDYISKPFHETELLMRIRTHLDLKLSRDMLEEKNRELQGAYETIEKLALTDSLTGLANRRSIMNQLAVEVSRCDRNGGFFSLIMCDIDFFKRVNDTYGHDTGDYVLRNVADVMRANLRQQDIVSRWGGEEFLIMLPLTELEKAVSVAEKLREAIKSTEMSFAGENFRVTMTFGVSGYDKGMGIEHSIKKADDALYTGKQTGRNKVVMAE